MRKLKNNLYSLALLAHCLQGSWSQTLCPSSTGKCPAPGSLELKNQQTFHKHLWNETKSQPQRLSLPAPEVLSSSMPLAIKFNSLNIYLLKLSCFCFVIKKSCRHCSATIDVSIILEESKICVCLHQHANNFPPNCPKSSLSTNNLA